MVKQRWRPVVTTIIAVLAIWIVAMAGYGLAKRAKMTAEKIKGYVASVDIAKLSGDARAKAIRRLEDMLNSLSAEERQKTRLEGLTYDWLKEMSEDEKSQFIEATMPTGFKQMLTAFEQLPDDKRRRAVDDALRRLRDMQNRLQSGNGETNSQGTNVPPPLSPELQAKVRTIGLKAFYTQSSAQTKAELAPVLEELQRVMESGRPFHQR